VERMVGLPRRRGGRGRTAEGGVGGTGGRGELPSIDVSGDDVGTGLGASNVCFSKRSRCVVLCGGEGGDSLAARGAGRQSGGRREKAQ
jgi:hypothetical protein